MAKKKSRKQKLSASVLKWSSELIKDTIAAIIAAAIIKLIGLD